jgi:hypothetical protein
MTHFDAVKWTYFASDDWQKAMQKHLGTGSKRRPATVALSQKEVNAAAEAVDASYQPPAETVRMGNEAFAVTGLGARPQETGGLIELLFDSFFHAPLAGIRSPGMIIRQMLYRAEPYQIDIQLEAQPECNRLIVTGQLLDVSDPEIVGRDVQVTLSDGRENVVRTMTNEFGEFRGDVENSGDLELSFPGLNGKLIVILLRRALG